MKKGLIIAILLCVIVTITSCSFKDNLGNTYLPDESSHISYNGRFLWDEGSVETLIELHIVQIAELKDGVLYTFILDDTVVDANVEFSLGDRKNLGYFYVQKDRIYKFSFSEERKDKFLSDSILPDDCAIVCQDEEYEDAIGKDERGWHEYILIKGNRCEYHGYSDLTETGFYERFIWEKEKGLVEYKSGFGAEKNDIELKQIG